MAWHSPGTPYSATDFNSGCVGDRSQTRRLHIARITETRREPQNGIAAVLHIFSTSRIVPFCVFESRLKVNLGKHKRTRYRITGSADGGDSMTFSVRWFAVLVPLGVVAA